MDPDQINKFKQTVLDFYNKNARSMPWRTETNPYFVVVSEIMLQQTQVERVIPKFNSFVARFPNFGALASASLADALVEWSGLGYNRRAKFIHQLAKTVEQDFDGKLPTTEAELMALPGVGKNTAGAILAYAYNQPVIYIETNIRTVFIHHFFSTRAKVADKEILPLIEATLDKSSPREWYWALMDYGTHIKALHPNPSRQSLHHSAQPRFEGSTRQLRGKVLKLLIESSLTMRELESAIDDVRLHSVLEKLVEEHLIERTGSKYFLPKE